MIAPGAPTLTEKTDPGPGVEVYFPSIDGAAVAVTVWRIADGLTEEVRGALRASAAGDFTVTDWEVPFGIETVYYGEIFDSGGASVIGDQASITVESDEVWLSDPIDPTATLTVTLEETSFTEISRPRKVERVYVMGVPRPFLQNWGVGAISGLPFTLWTDTTDEALALQNLLDASPLLIRTPPTFVGLPRVLFASIETPVMEPFDQALGGTAMVWSLTVDEVQPVSKAILRPLVTWADWEAAFPVEKSSWSGTAGASTSLTASLAPAVVTNLATNPSGETVTTGWTAVPGTSGTAAVTNPKVTGNIRQGSRELRCTWSVASSAAGGGVYFDVAVSAGTVYSFAFGRVRSSINNRLQLQVEWRTSSATVSTVTGTAAQVTAGTIYDEATFKLENQTAPVTATVARVKILSVSGTGYANWSIGSYLGVKLLICNAGATVGVPFDGDTYFGATYNDVAAVYGGGTYTDSVRNPPSV